MEKTVKRLINIYPNQISKLYIWLKHKLTPFKAINNTVPENGSILDIGCGNGMYAIYLFLKNNKRSITGIDNNKKRINYANKVSRNIKQLKFKYLDLNKEYKLDKYNCYLINDVLHHISDKSKVKLLKKVYMNMRKNDILVIKDMHYMNKIKFILNYINDKIMTLGSKLYFIESHILLELLKKLGFKVSYKKIDGYLFPHIIFICRK